MHLPLLLSLAFILSPAPVHSQSLLDALRQQKFTLFADSLERTPSVLRRFEGRSDITIFAPLNSCYTNQPATSSNATRHRLHKRRVSDEEALNAQQGSHTGPPPSLRRRQDKLVVDISLISAPASNFVTLKTFLEDEEYVNLGEGQPARIVQSYVSAPINNTDNCSDARIQIQSGAGGFSQQTPGGPWKWDRGLIYGVDALFLLPTSMSETLKTAQLSGFVTTAESQGQASFIEDTPGITIFAPNEASESTNGTYEIREHTLESLEYIAELINKKTFKTAAGGTITIEEKSDGVYVDDVKIIKSDLSAKNGVVHILARALGNSTNSTTAEQFQGAAARPGASWGATALVAAGVAVVTMVM